ncbi:MAG TPA: hypothetical protein VHC94_03595, partial [Nitrobacter sp.]|nr:hypothetical protein [Nitrobacter sp.]
MPVMPGFMPDIHVFGISAKKDVDGRDEPGHDGSVCFRQNANRSKRQTGTTVNHAAFPDRSLTKTFNTPLPIDAVLDELSRTL